MLVGAGPVLHGPREIAEVSLGQCDGPPSSCDRSTTPFFRCTDRGPTAWENPEAAALDHGPPMPMLLFSVAMTTSQVPRSAAFPAKQRPEVMPMRAPGRELAEGPRRRGSPAPPPRCRPYPGAAAAPFREEHHGQGALRQLDEPILLDVIHGALGTGQHRIVVAHHDGATAVGVEEVAVDDAMARHHPVGRGALNQVIKGLGAAAGRQ